VLPKFDVVTVNHSLGAFLRSVVVNAVEIDGFNEIAVVANQVCSIVRHRRFLTLASPKMPSTSRQPAPFVA
jgi:hypothetical protein